MSDIVVNTELTGERDDLLAEFRAAEQDAQQFVQRIGAMHAELPVTLNLAGATTALEAFVRQAQAAGVKIPITFEPTGGGGFTSAADLGRMATTAQLQVAAMQSPAVGGATASVPIPPVALPEPPQIKPYDVVEAGPYAVKPKAEIGKEFARITASRQAIEAEIEATELVAMEASAVSGDVEQAIANMGASSSSRGGGGGSGRSRGGDVADSGRSSRGRMGYGLYRYLSIAFAAREVIGSAIDARELGIEKELAGNDLEKQYTAEEGFVKKFAFTNLLLDPTGGQQLQRQRTVEAAHFGEQFQERLFDLQRATARSGREVQIEDSGGFERQRLEAEEKFKEEQERIESERRNDPIRASANQYAQNQIAAAESQRKAAIESANKSNLGGQISSGLRGASANEERDKLLAAMDAANQAYDQAVKAIEEDRKRRNGALDARLQQQLDDARQIRDIAVAHAQANQDRLNTENAINVREIEGERQDIRTRATGVSSDAEKAAFARKLNNETDQLNARRDEAFKKGDYEEAGRLGNQISALEAARPDRVAENNRRIQQEETKKNALNKIETADIQASADTATLRGEGREREAATADLNRSIDDRVAKLRAESEALKGVDNAESQRLANLAKATEATKQQVVAAQQTGNQRESSNNLEDIREAIAEANLSARGLRYQAGERSADARFSREERGLRQAGRNEEANEVEQEKVAARAARQALRSEDVRRVGASADQARLRNEFRDPEADLQQLEEQHKEEVFNAGGDPAKIAELNRLHEEQLRHFARQTVTGVHQTSPRDTYFNLQATVLGDPSGHEAQSRAIANAQARRELEHARPAVTPFLMHNIMQHGGRDGQGNAVHTSDPNKDAHADASKEFKSSVKDFKDAVDLMIAEAV